MEPDTQYRASHPQAWPIIAAYGAVVLGVLVFSYFNHEPGGRNSTFLTSVASADPAPRVAHPYLSGTSHSTAPTE